MLRRHALGTILSCGIYSILLLFPRVIFRENFRQENLNLKNHYRLSNRQILMILFFTTIIASISEVVLLHLAGAKLVAFLCAPFVIAASIEAGVFEELVKWFYYELYRRKIPEKLAFLIVTIMWISEHTDLYRIIFRNPILFAIRFSFLFVLGIVSYIAYTKFDLRVAVYLHVLADLITFPLPVLLNSDKFVC